MTGGGRHPLPSEADNCALIEVTEEEVSSCVRSILKLDTLILIKCMVKKHSFQNPFRMRSFVGPSQSLLSCGRSQSAPGLYEPAQRSEHAVYCLFTS